MFGPYLVELANRKATIEIGFDDPFLCSSTDPLNDRRVVVSYRAHNSPTRVQIVRALPAPLITQLGAEVAVYPLLVTAMNEAARLQEEGGELLEQGGTFNVIVPTADGPEDLLPAPDQDQRQTISRARTAAFAVTVAGIMFMIPAHILNNNAMFYMYAVLAGFMSICLYAIREDVKC